VNLAAITGFDLAKGIENRLIYRLMKKTNQSANPNFCFSAIDFISKIIQNLGDVLVNYEENNAEYNFADAFRIFEKIVLFRSRDRLYIE
jgi:hypothetical protein